MTSVSAKWMKAQQKTKYRVLNADLIAEQKKEWREERKAEAVVDWKVAAKIAGEQFKKAFIRDVKFSGRLGSKFVERAPTIDPEFQEMLEDFA